MDSGSRSYIYHLVCSKHSVLVVLHHDERVAYVAQMAQRGEQFVVISLMQTDARLVKNVQHTRESRAYLCGKPYPLRLAAGQRAGTARKSEVVHTHIHQKSQPCSYLL